VIPPAIPPVFLSVILPAWAVTAFAILSHRLNKVTQLSDPKNWAQVPSHLMD
jgi:hypothetical protein